MSSYGSKLYLSDPRMSNAYIDAVGNLIIVEDSFHGRNNTIGIIDKMELIKIAKLVGIKPEDLNE